jgi:hypothetical protein
MALNITRLDLFADWIEIAKLELQNEGYQTDGLDDDKLSILYFALQKKLIKAMPRNIIKSDVFNCPAELEAGLNLLEEKIKNGDDLRANLSRKLKNLSDQDGLLFDWGIHHLHLGTEMESDGFIKRTGPLLYARFDNENAYFINVLNHGGWTTQELLKTIDRNWSTSIEAYRLKGVVGVEKIFNDDDVKHLRNAQINTLLEIEEGVVYMGPGGGLAASGDSAESVFNHLQNRKGIKQLEKSINTDISGFLNRLFNNNLSFITNKDLNFKLKKENGKYYIYENNNDFQILLNN